MHTPVLPNYYAIAWTLVNFLLLLVPVAIIVIVIWYVKQKRAYQQQLLEKIERLICLLEDKTNQ